MSQACRDNFAKMSIAHGRRAHYLRTGERNPAEAPPPGRRSRASDPAIQAVAPVTADGGELALTPPRCHLTLRCSAVRQPARAVALLPNRWSQVVDVQQFALRSEDGSPITDRCYRRPSVPPLFSARVALCLPGGCHPAVIARSNCIGLSLGSFAVFAGTRARPSVNRCEVQPTCWCPPSQTAVSNRG